MKKTLCILCILLACTAILCACDEEPAPPAEHIHEWGEWQTQTKATCTTEGRRVHTCACGAEEQETLPVTHAFGEWTVQTEPTCKTQGSKTRTCTRCGASENGTVLQNDQHVYGTDNTCTLCGNKLKPTETLTYSVGSNGYTVTGCSDTAIRDVVIPAYYQGVPVVGIGASAFSDYKELSSVYIPPTVTSIAYYCFWNTPVKKVTFGAGIQLLDLGYYTFSGCTQLTDITLPETLTTIDYGTFQNCTALRDLVIPASVTAIRSGAFSGCTSLLTEQGGVQYVGAWAVSCDETVTNVTFKNGTVGVARGICEDRYQLQSVTLPDSLLYINSYAFAGCAALTSITIPASVTRIDGSAFQNCLLLSEINFNATAMNDLTYDNYVFSNAGRNGNGITVNIGANVTKIPACLFYPCSYNSSHSHKITAVNFAAGSVCTEIGRSAFSGCTALLSITIPASVTTIDKYAFSGCTALTEINFNATAMNDLTSYNYVFDNAGQNGNGITVNIGANVTKIPANLFYCSYSLSPKITAVNFAAGCVCTEIGERAFSGCTALTSVTIPASVTTIGGYAFSGCTGLTSVTFGNKEGWTAGSTALSSTDLQSTSTAATYLRIYYDRVWTRTQP